MRVEQIALGRPDLAFVRFDGADVLIHQRALGVELLNRNGVFLDEPFVAFEVQPGIGEQCLVAAQITLCGLQRGLVRSGIDLGNDVTFVHELPFDEQYLLQGAADLRAHGHVRERRDGAERGNPDLDVARRHFRHSDGHRAILAAASHAGWWSGSSGTPRLRPVVHDADNDECNPQEDGRQDQCRAVSSQESARRFGRRIGVISI